MREYTLILNEEQAQAVATACEFYLRMRIGQWNRLVEECLDFGLPVEEYCRRRDEAEALLLKVRKQVLPELQQHEGSSYGYGKFKNADLAYDVCQMIQFANGGKPPFSYYELPKCRVKNTEEETSNA